MRWLYIPDEDDPDYIKKQETIARIEEWWKAFVEQGKSLYDASKGVENCEEKILEFAQWVIPNLEKIHPDLEWEGRTTENAEEMFIVSAGDRYNNRAMIQTAIEMAPKLEDMTFSHFRPPVPQEDIAEYLEAKDFSLPSDIRFSWEKSEINKIDLYYYSITFIGNTDYYLEFTLTLTAAILGEEMLEYWINRADPKRPTLPPMRLVNSVLGKPSTISHNINVLQKQCLKLKKQIEDALPDQFIADYVLSQENEKVPYCMWTRKPDEDNVPDIRKKRCIYFVTIKSFLQALIGSIYFHSHCHSKLGEIFCYIETDFFDDGIESENKDFGPRERLMKKVDLRLRENKLGCLVGYGSGLDRWYLDLALTDVNQAIPILRKIASENNLPENSWLLFYDSHLSDEWVGMYPTTKSPFNN